MYSPEYDIRKLLPMAIAMAAHAECAANPKDTEGIHKVAHAIRVKLNETKNPMKDLSDAVADVTAQLSGDVASSIMSRVSVILIAAYGLGVRKTVNYPDIQEGEFMVYLDYLSKMDHLSRKERRRISRDLSRLPAFQAYFHNPAQYIALLEGSSEGSGVPKERRPGGYQYFAILAKSVLEHAAASGEDVQRVLDGLTHVCAGIQEGEALLEKEEKMSTWGAIKNAIGKLLGK